MRPQGHAARAGLCDRRAAGLRLSRPSDDDGDDDDLLHHARLLQRGRERGRHHRLPVGAERAAGAQQRRQLQDTLRLLPALPKGGAARRHQELKLRET